MNMTMCRVHLIKTKLKSPTGAKEYKMKNSKTIEEICQDIGYGGFPITDEGERQRQLQQQLIIDRVNPALLNVDQEYQRLIALSILNGYGKIKTDRLTLPLISRRPGKYGVWSGDYILDGQQRSCMYFGSSLYDPKKHEETGLQVAVKVWPEDCDLTIEQLRAEEAKLFVDTNKDLTKVTTLQKYRAAVMYGDLEAKAIFNSLVQLTLKMDNWGSIMPGADEVSPPTQYFEIIKSDLGKEDWNSETNLPTLQESLTTYRKIYPPTPSNPIHGTAYRSIFYSIWFANSVLGDGERKKYFKKFLNEQLTKNRGGFPSPKKLVQEQAGFKAPKYILHNRILPTYNQWVKDEVGSGTVEISNGILKRAANVTGVTSKVFPFLHPDPDDASKQKNGDLTPTFK